jgi:hypothetical protein
MKKKKPFKRNLILLSLILFVFIGLVIAMQIFKPEIVYLDFEEMEARNALRQDQAQNGWYDLEAAMKLLPPRPKPPKERDIPNTAIRGSVDDSIGSYLGLHLPESHPLMLEYVEDCRPVFERAAFALEKPAMLCDWPRVLDWQLREVNKELGLDRLFEPMAASVRMDFLLNKNPKRGATTLLLMLRLLEKCEIDLALYPANLIQTARKLIDMLIIHAGTAENLLYLEDVLRQTEDPNMDPKVFLARWFNVLDNTNHFLTTPEGREYDLDFEDRFMLWQFGHSTAYTKEYLPLFNDLLQLPASKHLDHFLQHGDGNDAIDERAESRMPNPLIFGLKYYFLTTTIIDLGQTNLARAHFDKYPFMIALQRFRNDHGEYPDTVNDLIPDYLNDIPLNPVADTPFRYTKVPLGYTLTGDGFAYINYNKQVTQAKEIEFVKPVQFERLPSSDDSLSGSEEPIEHESSVEQE